MLSTMNAEEIKEFFCDPDMIDDKLYKNYIIFLDEIRKDEYSGKLAKNSICIFYLKKYFRLLSPNEKKVISLFFGLDDGVMKDINIISKQLNLTTMQVIRSKQRGIKKLRLNIASFYTPARKNRPVSDMGFSIITYNALRKNGYKTCNDLKRLTSHELFNSDKFPLIVVKEISTKLNITK